MPSLDPSAEIAVAAIATFQELTGDGVDPFTARSVAVSATARTLSRDVGDLAVADEAIGRFLDLYDLGDDTAAWQAAQETADVEETRSTAG